MKLFISSSANKTTLVAGLSEVLRGISTYISIFTSSDVERGTNWRKEIAEQLRHTDVFLLVMADPTVGAEWSLYEAGNFLGDKSDSAKRLYVMHLPDQAAPSVLSEYQSVPVLKTSVEAFLFNLFEETTDVQDYSRFDRIRRAADDIVKLFLNFRSEYVGIDSGELLLIRSIELTIGFRAKLSEITALPGDAFVGSNNMEIFGLQRSSPSGGDWTWNAFEQAIGMTNNEAWARDISASCIRLSKGLISIIKTPFLSPRANKTYQTEFYRTHYRSYGDMTKDFKIILVLVELHVQENSIDGVDKSLVFVITAYRDDAEVIFDGISAAAASGSLVARRVKML